ncbi:hypothetical protein DFQ27_008266 [Actinomortierella ambigua]|uniref:Uncharacterized protein n=1 Tax=Actinomortierella ambigua TaxID=1343610 RepID=A0A9P6QJ41_9FUNG|nr:hypothetical protein DFQ27_008266 [Actinomortierella ambigua]
MERLATISAPISIAHYPAACRSAPFGLEVSLAIPPALDLHANEKVRAAGLEQTVELERLFGQGFTNLRYLRLQGGFVDNRLLSALLKGMRPPISWSEHHAVGSSNSSPSATPRPSMTSNQAKKSGMPHSYATKIRTATPRLQPCRLSQVFLGPGSVTDSAIEKLVAVAGHSLEVFRVMSCVDVGGGALATLLTRCPKLRVLGVYRSLARDRDLLEGLGIELDDGFPTPPTTFPGPHTAATPIPTATGVAAGTLAPMGLTAALTALTNTVVLPISTAVAAAAPASALALAPPTVTLPNSALNFGNNNTNTITAPNHTIFEYGGGEGARSTVKPKRKEIVAPLERLELGTVKLTRRGVGEILKGVSTTLRFLVLETQHLSESFLQDVVMPLGMPLEALHFNNPITVEHHHQGGAGSQGRQATRHSGDVTAASTEPPKISDWLGETTTDQWVAHGDGALWASVFDGYFEAGGGANQQSYTTQVPLHQQHQHAHQQHHPQLSTTAAPLFQHYQQHQQQHHQQYHGRDQAPFRFQAMDSDEILEHFGVGRPTIDAVLATLPRLKAFTVMQWDLLAEKDGAWEWMQIEREEAKWVQSLGFRALQALYLFLLLSYVFLGGVSVVGVGSQAGGRTAVRRQS